MMKVTYYCGLRNFTDYVCVGHPEGNYALKRARDWWRERSGEPMPRDVDAALDKADILNAPTHLNVWINTKYPQIMAYCFDGTNFGHVPADKVIGAVPPGHAVTNERVSIPPMTVDATRHASRKHVAGFDDMDDDIPF